MHNRLGITRIRRLGPLVACALAAAGIGSVFGDVPSPSSDTPAPDSIALQVAEETAKFDIKAKTSETTADKALSASIALRHGDFKLTSSIAREVLKKSRMEAFHFSPFNRFINSLSDGNEADFSAGVNQWVAQEPRSALAYLVRANYEYDTAWAIRGTDLPHKVTKEHWKGFKDGLTQAEDDIQQSLKLEPKIPFTYYLWVNVSASRGDEAHMAEVFQTAIARFPNYYELYNARLHFLEPKWHGSEETMYDFVAQYAGKAPAGSPLKVLYLQLAANLLNAAAFDCGKLKHELLNACVESNMNRHVTGVLTDGISQAFAVAQHVDPIQFNQAVWPILGALEGTRGESTAVNSILTVAAQAMGSENQLIHEPGHNNYVLDDITARIWMHLDNPANVDQKFREALDDVERTHFSVEEDKIAAEAAIYDHMAHAARTGSQWVRVIAYHDAANTVAGINHGGTRHYKCFAYYKLNRFQSAIDECTRLLDARQDMFMARYYRGRSYEGLKQYDAAITDFKPLAENGSDNYFRQGATIELGHVLALQGNYQADLDLFSRYPFLFDETIQPPEDLAVAYNNRCFSYMKTNQPEKALDDCNMSLRFGKLPDALQKQQQLLKQLNKLGS